MRLVSAYYNDTGPFMEMGVFDDFISTDNFADLRAGDVLVSWGGEDISPSLYNHVNVASYAPEQPSQRDAIEWALMKQARDLGIPIIGVCRGAQMLCALAGGHLIQHVNGHGGNHTVLTYDGDDFVTNSIHHQMMYPFDVEHELLAWTPNRSDVYIQAEGSITIDDIPPSVDPEYVYYQSVKGFAIQWHPEMMHDNCRATQYIFKTFKERL